MGNSNIYFAHNTLMTDFGLANLVRKNFEGSNLMQSITNVPDGAVVVVFDERGQVTTRDLWINLGNPLNIIHIVKDGEEEDHGGYTRLPIGEFTQTKLSEVTNRLATCFESIRSTEGRLKKS